VLAVLAATELLPELLAVLRSSLLAASCGPELVAAVAAEAADPMAELVVLAVAAAVAVTIHMLRCMGEAFGTPLMVAQGASLL